MTKDGPLKLVERTMRPKATTSKASGAMQVRREGIIQAVQTPLGFFALVVLVVEALLGLFAGTSSGTDRTLALSGLIFIITGLVAVVAWFAYHRPEALKGTTSVVASHPEPIAPVMAGYREPVTRIPNPNIFYATAKCLVNDQIPDRCEMLRKVFPKSAITEELLCATTLQRELTQHQFAIVQLNGSINARTGHIEFGNEPDLSPEGLGKLVKACDAKLVVLATGNSVVLASQLILFTNVIACTRWLGVLVFAQWEECFYSLLARGSPLSEAYDTATAACNVPMALLMKNEVVFHSSRKLRNS